MLQPWVHKLPMLGLGYSVGTGAQGIKAEVIVVKSFDELDARAAEVDTFSSSDKRNSSTSVSKGAPTSWVLWN